MQSQADMAGQTNWLDWPSFDGLTSARPQPTGQSLLLPGEGFFEGIPTPPESLNRHRSGKPDAAFDATLSPLCLDAHTQPPNAPAPNASDLSSWETRVALLSKTVETFLRQDALYNDLRRAQNAIGVKLSERAKKSVLKSAKDTKDKITEEHARLGKCLNDLLTSSLWPVPGPPSQDVIMSIRDTSEVRARFAEINEAITTLRARLKVPAESPEDGEIPCIIDLDEPQYAAEKVRPSDLSELAAQLPEIQSQVNTVRDALAEQKSTPDIQALWEAKSEELLRSSGVDTRIEQLQDQLSSASRDAERLKEENAALRNANEVQRATIEQLREQVRQTSSRIESIQTKLQTRLPEPCHCNKTTEVVFDLSAIDAIIHATLAPLMTETVEVVESVIADRQSHTLEAIIMRFNHVQMILAALRQQGSAASDPET